MCFRWLWMLWIGQWTIHSMIWFHDNRLDFEFDGDHQWGSISKVETAKCPNCWNIDERDYNEYWNCIFIWVHRANLEREPSGEQCSVLWRHKSESKETGNTYLDLCFVRDMAALDICDGQEKAVRTWEAVYFEIKRETMTLCMDPCTVWVVENVQMTFWIPSTEFETNAVRVLIGIVNIHWVHYKCLSTKCKMLNPKTAKKSKRDPPTFTNYLRSAQ